MIAGILVVCERFGGVGSGGWGLKAGKNAWGGVGTYGRTGWFVAENPGDPAGRPGVLVFAGEVFGR